MPKKPKAYLVVARVSTRQSADPDAPEFEAWRVFEPGDVVTEFPAHAPVDEWLASGHVEEAK